MPLGAMKTLQDVWNLPLGAFNQGMDLYNQQKQMDDQTLQDMYSQSQFQAKQRPLLLQQLTGQEETRRAQLPLINAQTKNLEQKNTWDEQTLAPRMEAFLTENKGKLTQAHLDEAIKAGQGMQVVAEGVWSNPTPGYAKRAKAALEKFGGGGLWNPEWDNLPADQLSMVLSQHGSGIVSTIPKFQQAMAVQGSKNEASTERAQIAAEAARVTAEIRAKVSGQIANARNQAKTPKKLEELAAAIKARALTETNPDIRDVLQSQYMEIMGDIFSLKPEPQPKPMITPEGTLGQTPPRANPFNEKPKLGTKENPIKLD